MTGGPSHIQNACQERCENKQYRSLDIRKQRASAAEQSKRYIIQWGVKTTRLCILLERTVIVNFGRKKTNEKKNASFSRVNRREVAWKPLPTERVGSTPRAPWRRTCIQWARMRGIVKEAEMMKYFLHMATSLRVILVMCGIEDSTGEPEVLRERWYQGKDSQYSGEGRGGSRAWSSVAKTFYLHQSNLGWVFCRGNGRAATSQHRQRTPSPPHSIPLQLAEGPTILSRTIPPAVA